MAPFASIAKYEPPSPDKNATADRSAFGATFGIPHESAQDKSCNELAIATQRDEEYPISGCEKCGTAWSHKKGIWVDVALGESWRFLSHLARQWACVADALRSTK